jgi:hypothetical protein
MAAGLKIKRQPRSTTAVRAVIHKRIAHAMAENQVCCLSRHTVLLQHVRYAHVGASGTAACNVLTDCPWIRSAEGRTALSPILKITFQP